MNVVAFNGSARKQGNTAQLIEVVFSQLQAEGIATELVELSGKPIQGCVACYKCFKNKNGRCAVKKDFANECIEKMARADAIILGSPVYFSDLTASLKALVERAGMVSRANDDMLQRKVGAAVVAARRGGATRAFDSINAFFFISQMIVPGSRYWNLGHGLQPGDVQKDEEGLATMECLGRNMAWLLKKLHG
ncbi:MAG: flavodoxin family protein [Desulfovibrionaceae bacterium]